MIGGPELILTGLGIGLIVAAPVGPVNVLCIQRALERGFWGGLAAGLGAVIGDGLIALFAAFGITAITGAIAAHKPLIKVIGGGVLVLFGLKLFFTRPTLNGNGQARSNAGGNMLLTIPQTFFLTITNPGAVLGMLGIFGSLGTALGGIEDYDEALIVVAAIMVGSYMLCSNVARRTLGGIEAIFWLTLVELVVACFHVDNLRPRARGPCGKRVSYARGIA